MCQKAGGHRLANEEAKEHKKVQEKERWWFLEKTIVKEKELVKVSLTALRIWVIFRQWHLISMIYSFKQGIR